jgi:hypothetical protein
MAKKDARKELMIVGQEQPAQSASLPEPIMPRMEYDAWWLLTQRRLNLQPTLKVALKKHFQARGFLESGRYDDGLRDFGIEGS